jgi:hypothetical protein
MKRARDAHACKRFVLKATLLCACFSPLTALAQQADDVSAEQLVNYTYSSILGTGVYSVGDQTATVFQFPFYVDTSEATVDEAGIRVLLPVSLGFFDFDFEEILEIDSDSVATMTFLPGLELRYIVKPNWMLKPYLQMGMGTDFTSKSSSFIYAGGIRSLSVYDWGNTRISLGGELTAAGYNPPEGSSDNLGLLSMGLDFRFPTKWQMMDRGWYIHAHTIGYYYFEEINFQGVFDDEDAIARELEFGLSIATNIPVNILGLEFDRIGLGYRFGGPLKAITLVTNFPF